MTKAIDETWRAADGVLVFSEPDDYDAIDFSRSGSTQSDRARLAACAPEALRLLIEYEAIPLQSGGSACASCHAYEIVDHAISHKTECAWLLFMRKAGLR